MYRRGDHGQVARAFRVLDSLRGYKQGRWVMELAELVGASERSVRRDLAELQDAGVDVEVSKRGNRVYASLTAERNYSAVSITKRERFTLLAVRRVFDMFRRTPFLDDVVSVLGKLEQRMSDKERTELAAFGEQFVYMPDHGTKSYEGKEDIIDAVQTGIINRVLVRYRYADASGRARVGFLAPYRMAMYRHGLYVLGARLSTTTVVAATAPLGVFAIERFTEAEYIREHRFELPGDDPRVREVLAGAFGPHLPDRDGPHDVVVEFSKAKAQLVASREWHPSQQLTSLSDGGVQLALRAASLAPIVSWVLEWGPHARAVSPPSLVDRVVCELDGARSRYADARSAASSG